MATQSLTVKVPTTVLRLGESVVDELVKTAVEKQQLDMTDVSNALVGQPDSKRKALLKIVSVDELRELASDVAARGLSPSNIRIKTSFARRLCQVFVTA